MQGPDLGFGGTDQHLETEHSEKMVPFSKYRKKRIFKSSTQTDLWRAICTDI